MLKPLLERAGLSAEFSPYTLRRTFALLLRRANVSAREVSEQMGHTSAEFTERVYVTVYDSAKREMSDTLERLLVIGPGTQLAHNETDKLM
jgi:integrase